ncbi:hypothetical protein Taro_006475 [Colocasia esculenta]|uniref:RING-type E3 ubiquitin transferase n=1 Tax=Colocasia esculenta TaxID=4460 RepID=A0A843TSI2_COLES|nr:hypothetical protein [Colocasia esculenta]
MGNGGKPRWKLSSLYHRSPAAIPTVSPELLAEFVCPISGRLMADPVILPSGRTFELACVQACQHLGVAPPNEGEAALTADHLPLIHNMALRAAIHNWCDARGVDRPQPVDHAAALHLVRRLSSASPAPFSSFSSSSSANNSLQTCTSPASRASRSAASSPYLTATATAASSTFTSSSSSSLDITFSCECQCPPPKVAAFSRESSPVTLEEEILAGLGDPRAAEKETALLLLRSASRDGGRDNREALCTPRILAALRSALLSRHLSLQSHAAASLLNLSLYPPNRSNIVRAGAVPALVDVLKGGALDAQDHSAAALFSLSMDDDNKAALGALGALPPLLHLLSRPSGADRAQQDAAMALYHLSMAGTNRSKLVKLGAVKTLLGIATRPSQEASNTLPTLALMVLCNLAASGEARDPMMEAGAVEALVNLLRIPAPAGPRDPAWEVRREHCVAALYWMSRGSTRFRGLATSAGAEEVLRAVVEQEEAATAAEDRKRWRTREMAKRALRSTGAAEDGARDEVVFGDLSDPALHCRRRPVDVGGYNSTKF